MKVYILRHGETNWNKEKRMQCQTDNHLNEIGIEQAELAAKLLDNVDYDVVLSSPYVRAKRTAEIANRDRMPIIIDDRLKERHAGVMDGKLLTEMDVGEFFNYDANAEYEGAEKMQDFCKRIWKFLDELKEEYKDKTVLLVTHNIAIRAMKVYVNGVPKGGDLRTYGINNGEIEELILNTD